MRILYCIPMLYNSGGMERVLTQKVNWLVAHTAHEITILTTECVPKGQEEVYFPLDERVKVVSLHIDFNADYTKSLPLKLVGHMRRMRAYECALKEFVRQNRIDLCISLCGKEIAFLHTLPCRTIAELHFAKEHRHQLLKANHGGLFWTLLGRMRTQQLVHAVRPLEQLVVLTKEDKAEWQQVGCSNVICIPNPCALDGQKMPIPSHKSKTILAVGRLHEQKGFDLLLQAWKRIEEHNQEWVLRVVGEGSQRSTLEKKINELELKHVVLAGQAEDVAKEYLSASCFVLSSRYEGLPLALIEAMWCGLPCVAFDCPHGPKELLADNRGWLVPNGDIKALSEQIEYVLSHEREATERAMHAQTYARATYSEKSIMPQWVKLIEKK